MDYASGIRDAVYLGGNLLSYPPEHVKPSRQYAGNDERLADTSLASDYPVPYDDCEQRPRKFSFTFDWSRVHPDDMEVFEDLDGSAVPVDLCYWKPITESFVADGVSADFTIARRIAIVSIGSPPPGATTRYATEVLLNDVLKTVTTHYTIGSPTALGRVTITFVSTPSQGDIVKVRYVPLFLVKHTGSDVGFVPPHAESRSFTFEEVG